MMIEDEPNLVTSGKSQHVIIDGFPFSIEIYRLEQDKTWTLEVVDHEGTSHVWDDQFVSDKDARNTAMVIDVAPLADGRMRAGDIDHCRGLAAAHQVGWRSLGHHGALKPLPYQQQRRPKLGGVSP